jgi:hypothetical protein
MQTAKKIGEEFTEQEIYEAMRDMSYMPPHFSYPFYSFYRGVRISGECRNCGYVIGSRPYPKLPGYDYGCKKCGAT